MATRLLIPAAHGPAARSRVRWTTVAEAGRLLARFAFVLVLALVVAVLIAREILR